MKKIICILLAVSCISFSACSKSEQTASGKNGWYCEEILHNTFDDTPYITDVSYALEHMNPMKNYPLNLTEESILTGFFQQDISLNPENAVEWSREELKDISYADAKYNDSWYFDLENPAEYITLPEDLMPDFIRVTYSPKGNVAVNERECIMIGFSYLNAEKTATSDGMVFTWFHGEDTTGGTWNWNADN